MKKILLQFTLFCTIASNAQTTSWVDRCYGISKMNNDLPSGPVMTFAEFSSPSLGAPIGLFDVTTGTSVTFPLTLDVTVPGSYNFTTERLNGVLFSVAGSFSTTGIQTVQLVSSGNAISSGRFNYQVLNNAVIITSRITDVVLTFTSAGRHWMAHNLGAPNVPTATNDIPNFGSLYQWGRGTDGHELRNSPVTTTLSSVDTPGHNNFIRVNTTPFDWLDPQNGNLWNGINAVNNPCPEGFRVPTAAEFDAVIAAMGITNITNGFTSRFKMTGSGYRSENNVISGISAEAYYWTSGSTSSNASRRSFTTTTTASNYRRGFAASVRCIKN